MKGTLRVLRVVQWAMLGSIVLYAVIGEILGARIRRVDASLSYVFSTASVAIVGMIFVVRRTLVFRPSGALAVNPDDALALRHWKTGYIVTYALCELLALFGFVQRFMGFNLQQSLPYYIGGFVLLFFFGAREPVSS